MLTLVDSAVLIPSIPLFSTFFVAILLFSFNRTINRLTKPVSFLLINSILASTIYCGLLFSKHIYGSLYVHPLGFLNIDYTLYLTLSKFTEIYIVVLGIIALVVMTLSYFRLPRLKGYVRYLLTISFMFGFLFVAILSNPSFASNSLSFLN